MEQLSLRLPLFVLPLLPLLLLLLPLLLLLLLHVPTRASFPPTLLQHELHQAQASSRSAGRNTAAAIAAEAACAKLPQFDPNAPALPAAGEVCINR